MVVRLLVQPGEGKHWIVPKRHEPLAANATSENVVLGSTALAAAYTSYARGFSHRVGGGARGSIAGPALFVRSNARLGVWFAAAGAAVNWYYHHSFTAPVLALSAVESTPWKLWEKTEKYTVDDGMLAGAGVGLAAALALRRMPVSLFARVAGLTTAGAAVGVVSAHAWFQYRGERQPAVAAREEWNKRRNLEFHWLYWNKVFMSTLSPVAQGYVVLNGVFKANSIPEETYKAPEKFGIVGIAASPVENASTTTTTTTTTAAAAGEEQPAQPAYPGYYVQPYDHASNLRDINPAQTLSVIDDMQRKRHALLTESESIITELCRHQYAYCHPAAPMDEDEKQRRQRECQLLEIAFNRTRSEADGLARKILLWRKALQQKAAWESPDAAADTLQAWTPALSRLADPEKHAPILAIQELDKVRESIVKEIAVFEENVRVTSGEARKNNAMDLENGRMLLRAADRLVWELEARVKRVEGEKGGAVERVERPETVSWETQGGGGGCGRGTAVTKSEEVRTEGDTQQQHQQQQPVQTDATTPPQDKHKQKPTSAPSKLEPSKP